MWSNFDRWLASDSITSSHALTCLDLVGDGSQALSRLNAVFKAGERVAKSGEVHWVWVTDAANFPIRPPDGLPVLPGQWPAPLPGIHRCWLTHLPYRVSLTIVIGDRDTMLSELALMADWVLVDSRSPIPDLSAVCQAHTQIWPLRDSQIHNVPLAHQPVKRVPLHLADEAWFSVSRRHSKPQARRAVVVGAGISGLTTAAVLGLRGWSVTVIDPYPPGAGSRHAAHLTAALTPVISSDDNERSQLSRAGAIAADRFWAQLPTVIGQRCGALQLQKPADQRRSSDLAAVSDAFGIPAWAHWVDAAHASERAGQPLSRGGLWFPGAWSVQVAQLLNVLATMPGVTVVAARADRVLKQAGVWQVLDESATLLAETPNLVLANAGDSHDLLTRSGLMGELMGGTLAATPAARGRIAGLHQLSGEVTYLPAQSLAGGPACIVGGDGYVLPAVDGWCISGGTYVRGATQAVCTPEGVLTNIERASQLLDMPDLKTTLSGQHWPGWAGFRAVLPGRLPAIGPTANRETDGLWLFTGGASRGLTWSVLGAELIADALDGAPLALKISLIRQVFPGL